MLVLGIDPGIANTGYGVVRQNGQKLAALDGGMIKTAPPTAMPARLAAIHSHIGELINRYQPDALAIEDIYFGVNVRSAFAVGQARGVALLAAGLKDVACWSYTPQQIKNGVCGSGRANKDQVQRMVQTLLSLKAVPKPDHVADALAVAICHLNAAPLAAAVGTSRL